MTRRELLIWVVFGAYAIVTAARVRTWRSDLTLWTDAASKAPCLGRPRVQLELTYARRGDVPPALWRHACAR